MSIISGGSGALSLTRATLTDAQVKAVPTTPVTVIAAPGAGKAIMILTAWMRLDARGGAYTNLTGLEVQLNYGAAALAPASAAYVEASQGAFADASAAHVLGSFDDQTGGSAFASWMAEIATVTNSPVTVFFSGTTGNLTGGNAANSLTVDVLYHVLTL